MSRAARLTLIATVVGSGVVFLDTTVINVALPKIGRELPSARLGVLEAQSYVYNAYLLTLSALLVLAGALNDHYGRRRMFLVGLGGFGVTSLACGLAPSMELLIAGRILQGAAGAVLVPGSLSLLTATFSGEQQGRAFGIWAGASAGTTILGPFIGGALVDILSWRAAFLINLPFIAVAAWATLAGVVESRDESSSGQFDWLGAFVVAGAVGGLSFGTIYGSQREWRDPLGFMLLGAGALATLALPFLMMRRAHPLIPPALFRSRNFTVTNVSTFLIYGALYVQIYYVAVFLQGTLGYTAAGGGLATTPGTLLLVFFSSRIGKIAGRYGPRVFMAVGPVVMMLGQLWYARIPPTSRPWLLAPGDPSTYLPPTDYVRDVFAASFVYGIGLLLLVAPLTTALMTSVPVQNSGVASAINNAISRVGPQLAGALIFLAITASFYSGLHARIPSLDVDSEDTRRTIAPLNVPRSCGENTPCPQAVVERLAAQRDASTEAFHLAMIVASAMLGAGALVNALGIRNPRAPAEEARAPLAA